MEDYKNYIAPAIALLVMLAWFFVIQPRMAGDSPSADEDTERADSATAPQ